MTAQASYRKFLRSDFWKEMSAAKRESVGRCEKCRSKDNLQAHHKFYRADWYETQLDDLSVLCRSCHRKEHGLGVEFFPYRPDDERFNRIIHRFDHLFARITRRGVPLRFRDIAFLNQALKDYPATKTDACIPFKVGLLLELNVRFRHYGNSSN